jgi:hypothetical protein
MIYETPSHPKPRVWADSDQPGFWAKFAMDSAWTGSRKSALLYKLRRMKLCREPSLRDHTDGMLFLDMVNEKTDNLEALLAQSIGQNLGNLGCCDRCLNHKGIFSSCVTVASLKDIMPECANCHLKGEREECNFVDGLEYLTEDPDTRPLQRENETHREQPESVEVIDRLIEEEYRFIDEIMDSSADSSAEYSRRLTGHSQHISQLKTRRLSLLAAEKRAQRMN